MKDGIIKGTGNSRYLKSAIPSGTTWEQALAMLTSGTFPIDFNGINENGWQQLATALNKANLLSDSTKNSIGLTQADPTVDNALSKLRTLITTAQTTATARARIEVGSYVGTGTYGASNPNSITCSFAPKLLMILGHARTNTLPNPNTIDKTFFLSSGHDGYTYTGLVITSLLETTYRSGVGFRGFMSREYESRIGDYCKKSSDGKTISWYIEQKYTSYPGYPANQFNDNYYTYYWLAIA